MNGRVWFLMALLAVTIAGCSKPKSWNVPTDDPNWVLGYKQGLKDGADQAREDVCNEIRRYKKSIAYDLNENTQICRWAANESPSKQP
jgi:hypothetical protein